MKQGSFGACLKGFNSSKKSQKPLVFLGLLSSESPSIPFPKWTRIKMTRWSFPLLSLGVCIQFWEIQIVVTDLWPPKVKIYLSSSLAPDPFTHLCSQVLCCPLYTWCLCDAYWMCSKSPKSSHHPGHEYSGCQFWVRALNTLVSLLLLLVPDPVGVNIYVGVFI